MSTGLEVWMLPVDKFVRVNDLKEVTNPIYLIKNLPTPDGVLSYEIFGTSQADRMTRMAYIDLHDHYMTPLAAIKLKAYNRKLSDILFSVAKYRLESNGELIQDDEKGNTGPEFLYSIWGKVKTKEKSTVITKEVEEYFQQDKSMLFVTKYPVIPAFYRDINEQSSGNLSSNKINSMYSSIISYTQSLHQFTDTFTMMKTLTQSRVQKLITDIYNFLMITNVKGSPSKFGMWRRSLQSKNVDYSARLVITAAALNKESFDDVMIKYGYGAIPLSYCLSCFFPFMVHYLKKFFDAEFIQGGKVPTMMKDGKIVYTTITESFDENAITKMISRYINSPSTRFDPIETPPDVEGRVGQMTITGRFLKNNTTFNRRATVTDILYMVAKRALNDKHVYITRYPVENYNGQFPVRVEVASTIKTEPVQIGETTYRFFPVCEGEANNAFVDTCSFSNTYLELMGGDFDGDQVSLKPCLTIEANQDAEKRLTSNAYLLNVEGKLMRGMSKDFVLTAYNLTKGEETLPDANAKSPLYSI